MGLMVALYASVASLLAGLVLHIGYELLFSPLRHVPGPFLARFTRLWYLRCMYSGKAEQEIITLHRKYAKQGQFFAPVVRLAPNMYSVVEADKSIYGVQTKATKSLWYESWKHPAPERWTLFPLRNIKLHAEVRRKFQGLYSMTSMISYETYVDESVDVLVSRLRKAISTAPAGVIDLANLFQCYAFDVVGMVTYGSRFGFLDSPENAKSIFSGLDSAFKYSALAGLFPSAHPYLYSIMERIPGSGAASRNMVVGFGMRQLKKKQDESSQTEKEFHKVATGEGNAAEPEDFVTKMLNLQKSDKQSINAYHISMMSLGNIFAGSDTVAITLSAIFMYLVQTPRAIRRLRAEVQDAQANLASRSREALPCAVLQNMPYLQACVKEALRLHSAVGLPLWRQSPSGGVKVGGEYFPASVDIGLNPWVAHYNADIWGPDTKEFRPERWIEAEAEGGERPKVLERNLVSWGLGSRTCIGKNIAMLEMTKLIPRLIQEFDMETAFGERNFITHNHWFVKPSNFFVRLRERV
ncbi:uncharacterized protein PV09_08523 [Verruconis gallopava]|uniref:Cytochrome P450 n=1 Tax=Verruconis gallopava TaxID=253628 RepID=A0A0D1XC64_9PEZI|nr:uncharacterized protein PV09_08523 [Verruconis gallopava]KIV99855.1 hypothetical protein PV09_08523 [Verruconis gallopava]